MKFPTRDRINRRAKTKPFIESVLPQDELRIHDIECHRIPVSEMVFHRFPIGDETERNFDGKSIRRYQKTFAFEINALWKTVRSSNVSTSSSRNDGCLNSENVSKSGVFVRKGEENGVCLQG